MQTHFYEAVLKVDGSPINVETPLLVAARHLYQARCIGVHVNVRKSDSEEFTKYSLSLKGGIISISTQRELKAGECFLIAIYDGDLVQSEYGQESPNAGEPIFSTPKGGNKPEAILELSSPDAHLSYWDIKAYHQFRASEGSQNDI